MDMRKAHQMPFGEFAVACEASGAVDRWPDIVSGVMTVGFHVYMNGDVSKNLSTKNKETEFQGVTVTALTEALGLNPESFRDNLRVAEILATRTAWMGTVREANMKLDEPALSDQVMDDYAMLADNKKWLKHPWIQGELLKQQALSKQIVPALKEAEAVLGVPVADRPPYEISRGQIVSQNTEFSIQSLESGEVVTHENRRLETLPEKGKDVTVMYYRGSGQIQDNTQELYLSTPFIDDKTQDIAITLQNEDGSPKQVLLFNGASTFAKFVEAHNLDAKLTEAAIEARIAKPKVQVQQETQERKAITGMYIDPATKGLAFDYTEGGQRNTMIFGSAKTIRDHADTFGITPAGIAQAEALEVSQKASREQSSIPKEDVRTVGPSKMMNEARMQAAKLFPNNYDKQAQFINAAGKKLEEQAKQAQADRTPKPAIKDHGKEY